MRFDSAQFRCQDAKTLRFAEHKVKILCETLLLRASAVKHIHPINKAHTKLLVRAYTSSVQLRSVNLNLSENALCQFDQHNRQAKEIAPDQILC
jgi:hypothetical protein